MPTPPPGLAAAIAQAARTINTPRSLSETLEAIVTAASRTVPGFEHVSVSIARPDGTVETRAASDASALELDEYQYDAGEGPCLEALATGGVVAAEDVRHEQRWPTYVARAARAGVTAQMGVHLHRDRGTVSALNLYKTTGPGIDLEAREVAEIFATHAALALARSRNEQQLNIALSTRRLIGQATGIVMERYQINERRAFDFLVRVSNTGNIKLRDVSEELVTETDARYTV